MRLSKEHRRDWESMMRWRRGWHERTVLHDKNTDAMIAIADYLQALEAEVERLRAALQEIANADVRGWDDGGRLAAMCQRIAQDVLEEASDGSN